MPVSWRLADGLVRLESDDPVTIDEWRSAVDGFSSHPDYRHGMSVIHDRRRRSTVVTTKEIRERAEFLTSRAGSLGSTRWAIVAVRDVDFGMARLEEALLGRVPSVDFALFRDPATAEKWARGGRSPG
jgi:hypothetical protein